MATKAQRIQSIGDAIINGTATTVQLTRMADAFIKNRLQDPSGFTPGQKAEFALAVFRDFALSEVKRAEGDIAADGARSDVRTDVDAGFMETT